MDNASDTNENAATTTKRTHGMLLIKTPSPSRRRRRRIVASPGGCVPRRGTTSSPAITARIRTAPRSMPLSSPVAPNRTSTHFRTPPPRRSRPPPRHAVGFALEDLTNQNEYVDSLSIGGDDDEVFSVISCDGEASPHVTELDFLSFNQNDSTPFSLFTPSPATPATTKAKLTVLRTKALRQSTPTAFTGGVSPERASPTSSRSASSRSMSLSLSSPSRFFRSPCKSARRHKIETKRELEHNSDRQDGSAQVLAVPLNVTTPPQTPAASDTLSVTVVSTIPSSRLLRTPSPATNERIKAKRLHDRIRANQHHHSSSDSENDEINSDVPSSRDPYDRGRDHDWLFSFANSLSPLATGCSNDDDLLTIKFSPLAPIGTSISTAVDIQRLLPPFPSPSTTPSHCLSSPDRTSCSRYDSFPNIRAYTSATPGRDERLKLCPSSVMKMKLHVSFADVSPTSLMPTSSPSSASSSHSKREMETINNTLKRHKRERRWKRDDNQSKRNGPQVQRKLLQTPVKDEIMKHRDSPSSQERTRSVHGRTSRKLLVNESSANEQAEDSSPSISPTSSCSGSPSPHKTPMTVCVPWRHRTPPISFSTSTKLNALKLRKKPMESTSPSLETTCEPVSLSTPSKSIPVSSFQSTPLPFTTPPPTLLPMTPSTDRSTIIKKAPCNCKKSKCLKLYCECFASGGYCDERCNCIDCANTKDHESVRQQAITARLEKNPNAFKPKIETGSSVSRLISPPPQSTTAIVGYTTPNGLVTQIPRIMGESDGKKMHKHGCHCKKSQCQKKYCECFQANVPCGENCRCMDCKNQSPYVSTTRLTTGTTPITSATGRGPALLLPCPHSSTSPPSSDGSDTTFLSPPLPTIRQRLRIDRETWARNFSSPFERSPRREQARTERFRTQLQQSMKTNTEVASPLLSRQNGGDITKDQGISPLIDSSRPPPSQPMIEVKPTKQHVQNPSIRSLSSDLLLRDSTPGRIYVLALFGPSIPPIKARICMTIFQHLSNADLYNASLVNHLWNQVSMGHGVWDHSNFRKIVE